MLASIPGLQYLFFRHTDYMIQIRVSTSADRPAVTHPFRLTKLLFLFGIQSLWGRRPKQVNYKIIYNKGIYFEILTQCNSSAGPFRPLIPVGAGYPQENLLGEI